MVRAEASVFSGSFGNENGFGEEVKGDGTAGVTVVEGIKVPNGFEGGDAILDGWKGAAKGFGGFEVAGGIFDWKREGELAGVDCKDFWDSEAIRNSEAVVS